MAAELVLLQAERLRYALPNSTMRRSTTAWLPRLKLIRHTMLHTHQHGAWAAAWLCRLLSPGAVDLAVNELQRGGPVLLVGHNLPTPARAQGGAGLEQGHHGERDGGAGQLRQACGGAGPPHSARRAARAGNFNAPIFADVTADHQESDPRGTGGPNLHSAPQLQPAP